MTRTNTVNGIVLNRDKNIPVAQKVTIRYTEDEYGKTLSLSDETSIIISVAFEEIEELIK